MRLRYYWLGAALAVALFALSVVACVLLFFGAGLLRAESTSLHTSLAPSEASSALDASIAASGSLDRDVNNDGQVDGIADSLVVQVVAEARLTPGSRLSVHPLTYRGLIAPPVARTFDQQLVAAALSRLEDQKARD